MLIYKIYGKAGTSADMAERTVKIIEQTKSQEDLIIFVDLETSEGYTEALSKGIFLLPTIIVEDQDGQEIGYLENNASLDNLELPNINLSNLWWEQLQEFAEDMKDI